MTTPTDPTAALKLARDALAWLHDMAEDGKSIGHLYDGDCPDDSQPASRDPACPACKALDKAAAALAAIDALPAPSVEPADGARYRMLRDNGYLDRLIGDLHPCDEPNRSAITDQRVDAFMALHAPTAQAAPAPQAEPVAEFESWVRADSTLPLTRDAHGYADFNVALMWHAWQAATKANAPGGALVGGSDANARPGLAGADSACAHEFALQPSSSILLCCRCGVSETAVRSAQRHAAAPAAAAPVQPLTEAQMLDCVRSVGVPAPMGLTRDRGPYEVTEPTWFLIQLVRSVERAHGITATPAKESGHE